MKASTTLLAASALVSTAFAGPAPVKRDTVSNANTPPVTVKGNAFYANNKRFYIRGVDYQPGGSSNIADPIADANSCARDVAEFKKLGINTVRVYTVDNSANHDSCMKALADAGIYLALDVNSPQYSLNRADEASIQRSYNDVYLQFVFATIDTFAKYDNTLLFYSANEVINDNATSFAAPYVKAVTRDMRAYIKARSYRSIPVGYSAADIDSNRLQMAQYMNCGSDDVRSDFFAFNDYSWCDPSTFSTSGWDKKVAQYSDYSLPIFLSEFGCNTNKRDFGEIAALYSTQMTSVYSGGLVYEYSMEANKYGLVQISGSSVSELDDFTTLQTQYKNNPIPSGDGGAKASGTASTCPPFESPAWVVNTTQLPALPAKAQAFFTSGAGTAPGLSSKAGSQNAGTASTGFSSNSGVPATNGTSSSGKKSAASSVSTGITSVVLAAFGVIVMLL
ncbi:1,3-beta-glucanosyltransferase gel1 [Microthyrium microscopicum]|uniref:1,3-beta-glucanosyltransferase n=1 Tax=Microthyrium microscopicum TaxID=703497 RepID=A0A6A6UE77_9PEZI|nr:1,3-beta-glucanosyltransferase gel1 [Microthyrium microscopicum]